MTGVLNFFVHDSVNATSFSGPSSMKGGAPVNMIMSTPCSASSMAKRSLLGDRIEEFGVAAGLEVQQQRHDADAFWQDPDQLFERARASSRPDHSDDAAPQRKAHG